MTPSAVTALVAEREIARAKAEGNEEPVIIYNLITSKAVPELVEKLGGRAVKDPRWPLLHQVKRRTKKRRIHSHGNTSR